LDWRKFLLGTIITLALGAGYYVLDGRHEFKRGLDIQGGMHLVAQAQPTATIPTINDAVMSAAVAVVRNRVDGLGVAEPLIQRKGSNQIIIDMPGIKDKDEALRIIGKTAVLTFRAHKADFPGGTPAPVDQHGASVGSAPTVAAAAKQGGANDWVLTGLKGTHIIAARVEPIGTSWAVVADFNAEGAKILADTSRVLLQKPMAIFLDNELVSDPIVHSELNTGNVQISGNFDAKKANELMVVLKAGSLPVPLAIIENRSVDASLGAESVRASVQAGLIGAALIVLFMIGYYRIPGAIAGIALIIYSLIVLAIFKLIPVTLTVPGIAGFILSMGMAVDANILIFERTKEELLNGRTIYAAIEIGFNRAFSAIFDSNITTLLSCGVLFYFGTGLVKGFALTLAIGVIISMFTAITASRNLLHWVLEAKQFKSPTLFGVQVPSKIR